MPISAPLLFQLTMVLWRLDRDWKRSEQAEREETTESFHSCESLYVQGEHLRHLLRQYQSFRSAEILFSTNRLDQRARRALAQQDVAGSFRRLNL